LGLGICTNVPWYELRVEHRKNSYCPRVRLFLDLRNVCPETQPAIIRSYGREGVPRATV
jgi:hypothetical protein